MDKNITLIANTIKEAEQKLSEQISAGIFVISITKHRPQKLQVERFAPSVQEAFKHATKEIPENAKEINKHIVREASVKEHQVNAFSENDAREKLNEEKKLRHNNTTEITGTTLLKKGKTGFLGIGKKPNTYSVCVLANAIVTVNYESPAKIDIETTEDIKQAEQTFISAAECGDRELIKLLLKQGININCTNSDGATALMLAVFNSHHNIASFLIKNQIDVNTQDQGGFNALMLACEAQSAHINTIKQIIEKGANINSESNRSSTALMAAAKSGHLDIVKLLVDKGAEINATNTDHNITSLIWAANEGHIDIVKHLLEKGADTKILTHNNYTAATIAKENGHYSIVNLLNQYK